MPIYTVVPPTPRDSFWLKMRTPTRHDSNKELINFAPIHPVLRVLGPKREGAFYTVLLGSVDIDWSV